MTALSRSCVVLFLSLLAAGPTVAAVGQEKAVRKLGTLNGVALQCRYTDEVRRIKAAVIAHAPRTDAMGTLFQDSTNESFLTSAQGNSGCPLQEAFSLEVDAAIKALQGGGTPTQAP